MPVLEIAIPFRTSSMVKRPCKWLVMRAPRKPNRSVERYMRDTQTSKSLVRWPEVVLSVDKDISRLHLKFAVAAGAPKYAIISLRED